MRIEQIYLPPSGRGVQSFMSRMLTALGAGTSWFVDATNGADTYTGRTWSSAFKTIAYAVSRAAAGDTIFVKGSFSEEVTIASTLTGLSIIGLGTGPQEAQWTGDADETCLTINATCVLIEGIKFRPPAYSSGTPAAISLGTGASYAKIRRCRFQGKTGSYYAIFAPATGADNVEISDCEFIYLNNVTTVNGSAIVGLSAANAYSGWQINRNQFNSCVVAIDLPGRCCHVVGNTLLLAGNKADGTLGTVMTTGIHLDGNGSGCNVVTLNQLGGTYNATLYKVGNATGAADQWAGNYNVGMTTTGVTVANPA